MKQMIEILNKKIERLEYRDVPVVTFKQIDEVHGRPSGTAYRAFGYHRDRHVERRDYFTVPYEEWKEI